MNRVAARSGIVLLLVFILLGGFAFFVVEYVTQADDWVVFAGSPYVYQGGKISCGVVTDRDGTFLADLGHGRIYSDQEDLRKAVVHWLGDRKGSVDAPALSTYAAELSGFELLNGVYAYGDADGVASLTLSSKIQLVALNALGDRKGTIGVYNYKTGEIVCAVSTPAFDPDQVPDVQSDPDRYEGMYINRFIQSRYTPGSIFKIVTLAAALEAIPDIQQQEFVCTGSCTVGADTVTCDGKHGKQNLKQAFRNSCNCAFAEIALQLGTDLLTRYVEQFGITESVSFDGITTVQGNYDLTSAASVHIAWSGIGQYTDLINPCAYMTFVGAIAAGGKGVNPYIVGRVGSGAVPAYIAKSEKGERRMSEATAETICEYMGYNVADKYGSENFPGLTVCAKTGTAEVGGNKKPNAVFTGFVQDDNYPFAFIVIVEDGGYGKQICVPIMSEVLAACKEMVDQ